MRPNTYTKSDAGQIRVGGVLLADLARQFGTPLYVMDFDTLVSRMTQYREALSGWGRPYYAGKAFCCRAMVDLVSQEGLGLDVVSGGELATAAAAGMDPSSILFHGNVKTLEEIRLGLSVSVGHFVVDSLNELRRIDQEAAARHTVAPVLLRLTPGIEAHTHEFVRTGHFDSKFGFATIQGIADQAVDAALHLDHIRLDGFHAHIGSQILEMEPLLANAEALMEFSRHCWERVHFWPRVIDLGGGIGVRYGLGDAPPEPQDLMNRIHAVIAEWRPAGQSDPEIIVEPGRSIVAEAGLTLYTVEAVKTTPGGRTYCAVDGGMGDNIRPALYSAQYACEIDGVPEDARTYPITVAGRYCESGDILVHDAYLPGVEAGQLLVVWGTGAYGYSMSSTYNRVPRPAVVMVAGGEAQIWVERERWEDLQRFDHPLVRPREFTR